MLNVLGAEVMLDDPGDGMEASMTTSVALIDGDGVEASTVTLLIVDSLPERCNIQYSR